MKNFIKELIPYWLGVKIRGNYQRLQAFVYRGDKYVCPLCGKSFRKMLTGGVENEIFKKYHIIGGGRRPNSVCPRCYSTDRDRLVFLYLRDFTDVFKKNYQILHIAPEGSLRAYFMQKTSVSYTSGFKDAQAYKGYYYDQLKQHIDITSTDFSDNKFDVVICNHVLEHIEDDLKAMREIFRIMKPGGFGILQVPFSPDLEKSIEGLPAPTPAERLRLYGQEDHVRIYGVDYFDRLKSVGFEVNKFMLYHSDSEKYKNYAINPEEPIIVVKKSKLG
ncbi:MAG: hypothetical protein PWP35_1539 [Bacteroidales bacterium]|nr:hypothetical protein [Bacteroidales bacterium]